jgi:hypothetical protein
MPEVFPLSSRADVHGEGTLARLPFVIRHVTDKDLSFSAFGIAQMEA